MSISIDSDKRVDDPSGAFQRSVRGVVQFLCCLVSCGVVWCCVVLCCALCCVGCGGLGAMCCVLCPVCVTVWCVPYRSVPCRVVWCGVVL